VARISGQGVGRTGRGPRVPDIEEAAPAHAGGPSIGEICEDGYGRRHDKPSWNRDAVSRTVRSASGGRGSVWAWAMRRGHVAGRRAIVVHPGERSARWGNTAQNNGHMVAGVLGRNVDRRRRSKSKVLRKLKNPHSP